MDLPALLASVALLTARPSLFLVWDREITRSESATVAPRERVTRS